MTSSPGSASLRDCFIPGRRRYDSNYSLSATAACPGFPHNRKKSGTRPPFVTPRLNNTTADRTRTLDQEEWSSWAEHNVELMKLYLEPSRKDLMKALKTMVYDKARA